MTQPVHIVPSSQDDERLWRLVHEFADLMTGIPWTLIGGLMVRPSEAEHGHVRTGWTTVDVDAVVDVRTAPDATKETARRLITSGFHPIRMQPGIAYRFARADEVVDVLALDHLGSRASLITMPPDQTLQAVGMRQALARSRDVMIDAGWGPFVVPVPTLAGAILLKARIASIGSRSSPGRRSGRPMHGAWPTCTVRTVTVPTDRYRERRSARLSRGRVAAAA